MDWQGIASKIIEYSEHKAALCLLLARGAGAMAPKPPWLTQNFAQWRQDRTWLT